MRPMPRRLFSLFVAASVSACEADDLDDADGGTTRDAGGPCVVVEPHAARICSGDDVVWADNCGHPTDSVKSCGGAGCSAGTCVARPWFGLGSSEFGPHSTVVKWASASGYGVSGKDAYQANEPSIAIDPLSGRPLVAFDDANGVSTRIRVMGWDGASFAELGSSPSNGFGPSGTAARAPALAVDRSGMPMVAWSGTDGSGDYQVYFRQWDGSTWAELGGSGSGSGVSDAPGSIPPRIALDEMDRPLLVWQTGTIRSLRLERWDGSAWAGLGGSDRSAAWTGASDRNYGPSVVTDASGRVYVSFCETSTGARARVWNGAMWAPLGGAGSSSVPGGSGAACDDTAIAVGSDARPVVAWLADGDVYVRRWNGNTWQELDGSASGDGVSKTGGTAYEMSLAMMSNGDPVVSWRGAGDGGMINEFSVYLLRWNGLEWIELAGSASGDGVSRDPRATTGPDVAIDSSDHPFVAWEVHGQYPATTSLIHLRSFDGSDWVELGDAPAVKGGISNTYAGARGPRVALDAQRSPTVAWFDQTDEEGFAQILLRRWNGSTWAELAGSGTGRGISNASQISYYPALLLEPGTDHPIVAWSQSYDPSGNSEMYLRRWSGSAWEELGGSATAGGISRTDERSVAAELEIDGEGAPIVAWVDQTDTGYATLLRRFDGQSWAELAGSGHGEGINGDTGVEALGISSNGQPIVAWSKGDRIHVRRWNGTSWATFAAGGFDVAPDQVFSFDMAVGPADEIAVVWTAAVSSDNSEVRLRYWDGASWQSLAGSATGAGISANEGSAGDVVVELDERARPIVAWTDRTTGNVEVLLRRWDGFRWEEVLGSGSGGGVSNSINDSESVHVDFRDGRLCVTYGELGAHGQQIILRCVDFAPD